MTLLQVDYSQAELRAMAALSNDEWMLSALQEGQPDFFDSFMTPVCFPHLDPATLSPAEKKENRAKVKGVQYGLAFGRSPGAIGKALELPFSEAKQLVDNYLTRASNFAQWREDIMEAAITPAKRDLLVSPMGRRYQAEIITHKNSKKIQREALSFLPQATASDMCLITGIRINPDVKAAGGKIVALVHDAILIEHADEAVAKELGAMVSSEMRRTGEAFFDTVPFLSEWSVGRSWGDLV